MYFDADGLLQFAQEHREAYLNASPFPHIVIDDFLPAQVLDDVLDAFPTDSDTSWRRFKDQRHTKLLSKGDVRLSPAIRHVLARLRTASSFRFSKQ